MDIKVYLYSFIDSINDIILFYNLNSEKHRNQIKFLNTMTIFFTQYLILKNVLKSFYQYLKKSKL